MSRLTGRVNKREEALHNLEIARRQRLLPVQCWEKQWVAPQGALQGSTYKVLKWDFSDDETAEADEQQQPLRDEMEALAGAADQEIEDLEAAEGGDRVEGIESRLGSEETPDKPKKAASFAPDGINTGDITPAEPGPSPMPPSPPQPPSAQEVKPE